MKKKIEVNPLEARLYHLQNGGGRRLLRASDHAVLQRRLYDVQA